MHVALLAAMTMMKSRTAVRAWPYLYRYATQIEIRVRVPSMKIGLVFDCVQI